MQLKKSQQRNQKHKQKNPLSHQPPSPRQKQNQARKQLGTLGEELAKQFLLSKQYQIIETNFHTRYGELDLVCLTDTHLVFVEVKTRSNRDLGDPIDAVTPSKISKIRRAADIFISQHPQFEQHNYCIDVVSIIYRQPQSDIQHYPCIDM